MLVQAPLRRCCLLRACFVRALDAFVCWLLLISLTSVCLISSGIVKILLSCELVWLKLALLVIFDFRLGSKLPCLFPFLFYFLVRFRFLRTPCRFCSSFLSRVSCGRRAVSVLLFFLADALPFLFLLCTFFFFSFGRRSVSFLVLYRLIQFGGT